MATLTNTPSISSSSYSISGTTAKNGIITISPITIPDGCTITSCVLTGNFTVSVSKGNATVSINGTEAISPFTIDFGTSNTSRSVSILCECSGKNTTGTVTFSNLVYTVTYEEPVTKTTNVIVSDTTVQSIYIGNTEIVKVYIGSTLIYG